MGLRINDPLPAVLRGAAVDEEQLLEAIRAGEEAPVLALLESAPPVSLRAVRAALAHAGQPGRSRLFRSVLERLLELELSDGASGGHAFLGWVARNRVLPEWWSSLLPAWIARVVGEMPPGLARVDALGLSVAGRADVALALPGARVHSAGRKHGVVLGDLALLVVAPPKQTVDIVEADSPEDAEARAMGFVGAKKEPPKPEPVAVSDAVRAVLAPALLRELSRLGAVLPDAPRLRASFAGRTVELAPSVATLYECHFPRALIVDDDDDAHEPSLELVRPSDLGYGERLGEVVLLHLTTVAQMFWVVRVDDARSDPRVYVLDHDGSSGLTDGEPASRVLKRCTPLD